MPAYVDTGLNVVDVRDVAAGHIAAYERGATGERYILGNENLTLRACSSGWRAHRRPAPTLRLPSLVPLAYAASASSSRAAGLPPDVPLEGVRMAKQRMYYDARRQRKHVGLGRRTGNPSRYPTRSWFQEHGYLDHNSAPLGGYMAISLKQASQSGRTSCGSGSRAASATRSC
jgi:dihydroflavonol-4-reductase